MRGIRLGVFGARADRRGLASQTTEFCRHLRPDRILGLDMKDLSPYFSVWTDYPTDRLSVHGHDEISRKIVKDWLGGLDVVWGAETFYYPWFTELCQAMGVKTVLAVNPEFAAHVLAPDWAPPPDLIAPPTDWRLEQIPGARVLRHGVCRTRLVFRLRTSCTTFLHVGGHPAIYDRAGTDVLLEALPHVSQPCRVVIRTQKPYRTQAGFGAPPRPRHVQLQFRVDNPANYWELYADGDVLVTPRRYGGQHLPMMEALSCGMPVLVTDCSPQDSFLPGEMLVPSYGGRVFHSKSGPLPLADCSVPGLAARMDQLVKENGLVERLSKTADEIADQWSWPALIPEYHRAFKELCG